MTVAKHNRICKAERVEREPGQWVVRVEYEDGKDTRWHKVDWLEEVASKRKFTQAVKRARLTVTVPYSVAVLLPA